MIDLITLAAICTCISLVVSLVSLTVQCVALYIQTVPQPNRFFITLFPYNIIA